MTRAYSVAFKRKMVARLTGKDAVSANQLSRETGVRQQNLSRWLREAGSLPDVNTNQLPRREWTVAQKARLLADASELGGDALVAHLDRAGVTFAEFEQWRLALEEGGRASVSVSRQVRKLERELARKEKALAEAAALLVLKKTIESSFSDEDDDTNVTSER
jgi:transposase-like protein